MTCKTIKTFWSVLCAAVLLTSAALAQWPRNLDDDFISENKSTTPHGKNAPRPALQPAQKVAPAPAEGKPDALLALDTRKLMTMEGQIVTLDIAGGAGHRA